MADLFTLAVAKAQAAVEADAAHYELVSACQLVPDLDRVVGYIDRAYALTQLAAVLEAQYEEAIAAV